MSAIKKLIGQTAIYGSSSIIGRFLNYLLTPFYVHIYTNEQYGIITEMYAYVAFLVVFLTYGMETALFRFSTNNIAERTKVYSNTLFSLATTSTIFIVILSVFSQDIANLLKYPDHAEYIIWFSLIVGLDAVSSIPLANLRLQEKAKKFALVNFLNVGINIGLNLFFLVYCKQHFDSGNENWITKAFYSPEIGVGYVFISNLIASILKFIYLLPEMNFKGEFDFSIIRKMLQYASPMLLVGLAYVINETLDRAMLKTILFEKYSREGYSNKESLSKALVQNGIYGANYKITMAVSMFIQAFRYASEPFFFKDQANENSKKTLANVMNYFIILLVFIFLFINFYLHLFKYFIPNENYWEGLKVVPILLGANICLGVYTSLSIWYKLAEKTMYGALISIIGVLITLSINFVFIQEYGYIASAYATLICYACMMLLGYFIGQHHYPIPYNILKLFLYVFAGGVLFWLSIDFNASRPLSLIEYGYHSLLLLSYVVLVFIIERPKRIIFSSK